MPRPPVNALALSRRLLRVLIPMNRLLGVLILALLISSLIAPTWVMTALGTPPTDRNGPLILGMRLIMVIGILAVPVTNVVLTRLRAIVSTVNEGDPFVAQNADRLQQIAWSVLSLELLHLSVGAVLAAVASTAAPLNTGWTFSFTPWLAVLLLFVLARVFDHGTRMREELERTV